LKGGQSQDLLHNYYGLHAPAEGPIWRGAKNHRISWFQSNYFRYNYVPIVYSSTAVAAISGRNKSLGQTVIQLEYQNRVAYFLTMVSGAAYWLLRGQLLTVCAAEKMGAI